MHIKSIRVYEKAININPNDTAAHNNLGLIYLKSGKHKEAIKHYMKALKLQPNDAMAYYSLGFTYYSLGKYKEAIKYYMQGQKVKAELLIKGLIYYSTGDAFFNLYVTVLPTHLSLFHQPG